MFYPITFWTRAKLVVQFRGDVRFIWQFFVSLGLKLTVKLAQSWPKLWLTYKIADVQIFMPQVQFILSPLFCTRLRFPFPNSWFCEKIGRNISLLRPLAWKMAAENTEKNYCSVMADGSVCFNGIKFASRSHEFCSIPANNAFCNIFFSDCRSEWPWFCVIAGLCMVKLCAGHCGCLGWSNTWHRVSLKKPRLWITCKHLFFR